MSKYKNSMVISRQEFDPSGKEYYQDYLIVIELGTYRAYEINQLPGTTYKCLSLIDDKYKMNDVCFRVFEDLAILSGKRIDDVLSFLDIDS